MSPQDFEDDQNKRIEQAKAAWKKAAIDLRTAEDAQASPDQQRRLVEKWVDAGRDFFRIFNEAVADAGPIRGKAFIRWKSQHVLSAINVLHGLPDHKANIESRRKALNILPGKYQFAPTVFANIQSLVACENPKEAARLRQEFEKADLPTYGFEHPQAVEEPDPIMNPPDIPPNGRPNIGKWVVLTLIVLFGGGMGFGSLGLAAYALYLRTQGQTKVEFVGFNVSTDIGAVALLAVGFIILYQTFKKVMEKL